MVAERFNLPSPEEPSNRPDLRDLRMPFLIPLEGNSNSQESSEVKKKKRKKSALEQTQAFFMGKSAQQKESDHMPLGDEVIWQRPEGDAPEVQHVQYTPHVQESAPQAPQKQEQSFAYEPQDRAQPTAESYQPVSESVPSTPPPLIDMAPHTNMANNLNSMWTGYEQDTSKAPVEAPAGVPSQSHQEAVSYRQVPEYTAPAPGAQSEAMLSNRDLLRVAKDIKIDGIRLKDIYEAGRIDEEGLRAIVGTYLRGGDVRQQLTKELVVKERSYERDPQLRHTRMADEQGRRGKKGSGGQASGEAGGLLSSLGLGGGQLATSAQKTVKSAGSVVIRGAKIVQHDLIDNSNTTDWISVTAVVVLWSIILILLLG